MITHRPPSRARALVRTVSVGAFLAGTLVAAPAVADTPSSWESSPHVSALHYLLILLLIPLGLALVIALLAALPSLIHGRSYEPGQAWRSEGEWFGGPHKGVEAADDTDPRQIEAAGDQGGAGARF